MMRIPRWVPIPMTLAFLVTVTFACTLASAQQAPRKKPSTNFFSDDEPETPPAKTTAKPEAKPVAKPEVTAEPEPKPAPKPVVPPTREVETKPIPTPPIPTVTPSEPVKALSPLRAMPRPVVTRPAPVNKALVQHLAPTKPKPNQPMPDAAKTKELLNNISMAVLASVRLEGVAIQDASTTSDALVLSGRWPGDDQAEDLAEVVRRVMRDHKDWNPWADALALDTSKLQVVNPSPKAGNLYFNRGVRHFSRREYPQAAENFSSAVLESPDRTEYRYWLVLAEISRGNRARAEKVLRPLTLRQRSNPAGFPRPESVSRSIERVQGAPRVALAQMETAILESPDPIDAAEYQPRRRRVREAVVAPTARPRIDLDVPAASTEAAPARPSVTPAEEPAESEPAMKPRAKPKGFFDEEEPAAAPKAKPKSKGFFDEDEPAAAPKAKPKSKGFFDEDDADANPPAKKPGVKPKSNFFDE